MVPLRISFSEFHETLARLFLTQNYTPERASLSARLIAETNRDGVYSHGLNRVPRLLKMIRNGSVDVEAEPVKVGGVGVVEQWDGQLGPGNLNAHTCMERAISLAEEHGLGCVALRNTNHWMRGGTYGWQAADAGMMALCWTNTNQNLPPWGSVEPRIGNNPLIMAMPRPEGHFVLDMAMSQFSYGALATHRKAGKTLPVPGGYDEAGNLTSDPAAIEATWRPLPIGYWKGSALSIMLDAMAAGLSGGLPTKDIAPDPLKETGLCQLFIAIKPVDQQYSVIANEITSHLQASKVIKGEQVYYPGERTLMRRKENTEKGIPVDEEIWNSIKAMI